MTYFKVTVDEQKAVGYIMAGFHIEIDFRRGDFGQNIISVHIHRCT